MLNRQLHCVHSFVPRQARPCSAPVVIQSQSKKTLRARVTETQESHLQPCWSHTWPAVPNDLPIFGLVHWKEGDCKLLIGVRTPLSESLLCIFGSNLAPVNIRLVLGATESPSLSWSNSHLLGLCFYFGRLPMQRPAREIHPLVRMRPLRNAFASYY